MQIPFLTLELQRWKTHLLFSRMWKSSDGEREKQRGNQKVMTEVNLGATGTETKGSCTFYCRRDREGFLKEEVPELSLQEKTARKRSWGLILSTQGDVCVKARDRAQDEMRWEIRLQIKVGNEFLKVWDYDEGNEWGAIEGILSGEGHDHQIWF